MVLLFRMKASFDLLGEEAGKGNENAFQALTKCLGQKSHLGSFAPDALGLAAAAGNKDALNLLLDYKNWNILDSSAHFALCIPAKANIGPAVDYFVEWLANLEPRQRHGGIILDVTNALASASAQGNQKAQSALQKFEDSR